MPEPQSFKNHVSRDPFFLGPMLIFFANLILSLSITIRDWPVHSHAHLWWIVMSVALLALAPRIRIYSLRQQDRIIRLEERLRLAALLPPSELARAAALTTPQLIALRFASDAELPALVARTLNEDLTPKQIKAGIQTWRPDLARI